MSRLIDAESSSAGQGDVRQESPTLVLHGITGDVLLLHPGDERFYVVAHQIEFMLVVLVRWMHGDFRWR